MGKGENMFEVHHFEVININVIKIRYSGKLSFPNRLGNGQHSSERSDLHQEKGFDMMEI